MAVSPRKSIEEGYEFEFLTFESEERIPATSATLCVGASQNHAAGQLKDILKTLF